MSKIQNNSGKIRVVLCVELLKSFADDELDRFVSFISHPYFNTDKRLCLLLKKIRQYALDAEVFNAKIRSRIYESIFKETSNYDTYTTKQDKKLNEQLNKLLALALKFLKVEKVKDTDQFDVDLLYPGLINRRQLLLYSRRLNSTEKKLRKEKKHGEAYHTQCYLIQREKARLSFINNTLAKEDNYDELQYHADIQYLLQKLQYHLAKITLQRKYAHKTFNYKPYNALRSLLNLPEYQSNPLIQLHQLNIKLVDKEEESTFLALMEFLKEKHEVIPEDFLKPIYTNLTNHCTYQFAKGDLNYLNYMFEIYNNMHISKLLVKDSTIDIAILKNIITVACRIKEFDWANNMLEYYIKHIPKEIQKSVLEFNKGIIAFNQGRYEEALTYLIKVRKIDSTHDLDLRILQLQTYYETDVIYETNTQQMTDSLKTYIHQNKKLAKRQKIAYLNFIRIFNQLYKFKDIIDKRSKHHNVKTILPKLKNSLLQFKLIKKKQWLLVKIKMLESI